MAKQVFYQVHGKIFGPVSTLDELRLLATHGVIKPTTPIRIETGGPWIDAGKFRDLFDSPNPIPGTGIDVRPGTIPELGVEKNDVENPTRSRDSSSGAVEKQKTAAVWVLVAVGLFAAWGVWQQVVVQKEIRKEQQAETIRRDAEATAKADYEKWAASPKGRREIEMMALVKEMRRLAEEMEAQRRLGDIDASIECIIRIEEVRKRIEVLGAIDAPRK